MSEQPDQETVREIPMEMIPEPPGPDEGYIDPDDDYMEGGDVGLYERRTDGRFEMKRGLGGGR